ncbi:MAG: peptide-methionine (S)-S-oxide reductase MsrA [Spirochaetaceae bacterium]
MEPKQVRVFHMMALLVLVLLGSLFSVEPAVAQEETAKATFAGGCFWCMEPPYDELDGVISTVSGYSGGHVEDPTYEEVTQGDTGHLEVVQVTYDPSVVSYEELLEVYWMNVDPTDDGGQFCDRGEQYTTAIFYHSDRQRRLAERSKRELEESGRLAPRQIHTDIRHMEEFYRAEEYHQDYYRKNPLRYRLYVTGCGRESRLEELWGD